MRVNQVRIHSSKLIERLRVVGSLLREVGEEIASIGEGLDLNRRAALIEQAKAFGHRGVSSLCETQH
jgi:hypothetical protein